MVYLALALCSCIRAVFDYLESTKSIDSNPFHVLRHYVRQRAHRVYCLRHRALRFTLPAKDDRNFIPSLLGS